MNFITKSEEKEKSKFVNPKPGDMFLDTDSGNVFLVVHKQGEYGALQWVELTSNVVGITGVDSWPRRKYVKVIAEPVQLKIVS